MYTRNFRRAEEEEGKKKKGWWWLLYPKCRGVSIDVGGVGVERNDAKTPVWYIVIRMKQNTSKNRRTKKKKTNRKRRAVKEIFWGE